jgi:hypothetical protein
LAIRLLPNAIWPLIAALVFPAAASAQSGAKPSHQPRLFIGASVLSNKRPAADQDYHYVTPMFGGTTTGITGTVGVEMTSRVSVAVEASWLGGPLSGPFDFDHFKRVYATATESETVVSLLARVRVMNGRFRLDPVGGLVHSFEHITLTDRRDLGTYQPNAPIIPLPDVSGTPSSAGIGWGADAVAELTRHLALTASLRFVHYLNRNTFPAAVVDGQSVGIDNFLFQAGAGLRWTFK